MDWQQIIKLGKKEIVRLLQELEVSFNVKANYFFLCKLYRDSISGLTLTVADVAKKIEDNVNHHIAVLSLNHQFGIKTSKEARDSFLEAGNSFMRLLNAEYDLGLAID